MDKKEDPLDEIIKNAYKPPKEEPKQRRDIDLSFVMKGITNGIPAGLLFTIGVAAINEIIEPYISLFTFSRMEYMSGSFFLGFASYQVLHYKFFR